jgi:hypothetical protein
MTKLIPKKEIKILKTNISFLQPFSRLGIIDQGPKSSMYSGISIERGK